MLADEVVGHRLVGFFRVHGPVEQDLEGLDEVRAVELKILVPVVEPK